MKTSSLLLVILSVLPLSGQTRLSEQSRQDLRFDVTSVKSSNPDASLRHIEFGCTGGRFISTGTSALRGILWAWGIPSSEFFFRVMNFPDWAKGVDAFVDVEARTDRVIGEDDCKSMVRNLYADRYRMAIHWEEREISAFALTVSPRGSKIARVENPDEPVNGKSLTLSSKPTQMSMEQLAFALQTANLGRPVFDRTGLKGVFRIALSFGARETDGEGPDIATALDAQLGLRLEPRKEPIQVLVIDRMSKPQPN